MIRSFKYWLTIAQMLAMIPVALGRQPQARAVPPSPPSTSVALTSTLDWMEDQLIPLVEAMPAERFDFSPKAPGFSGVRTFAEQIQHVMNVNNALAAAILDEKIPDELSPESIDTAKAKAKLVDLLKKSSVFLHRAFSFVNEDNARVWIKHPIFGIDTTRLTLCSVIVAHSFDHYGQMVLYLRMNGIVPPASRQ
jgi:uncharacterized damage-inducible protein DinB